MRYVDNNYTPNHYPTIGLEFLSKQIAINDFKVKLQIWDTAGQ
jgi:GTPase SAR1 family protein